MNQQVALLAIDRFGDDTLANLSTYLSIYGLYLVNDELPQPKVPNKVAIETEPLAKLLDGYKILIIVAQCITPKLMSLLTNQIKPLEILTHLFVDCDSGVSPSGDLINYPICDVVNAVTVNARFEAIAAYIVSINNMMQNNIDLNVDFADLHNILLNAKVAKLASGIAFGDKRAIDAVRSAFTMFNLNHAKDYLINIYTSEQKPVTIKEVSIITGYIQKYNPNSNLLWQMHTLDIFKEDLMVNILASGFLPQDTPKCERIAQPEPPPGNKKLSLWQWIKGRFSKGKRT